MMMKVIKKAFDDGRILSPSGVVFRMGMAHNAYRQQNSVNIALMNKERGATSLRLGSLEG